MNKNIAIEIRPVANGFIVGMPFDGSRGPTSRSDVHVSRTMGEQTRFAQDHFDHRCSGVVLDASDTQGRPR